MSDNNQFDPTEIEQWISQIADKIKSTLGDSYAEANMLGIKTGGVLIANQLHKTLELKQEAGELNISFYRDDFSRIGLHPRVGASNIPFTVDGAVIILVDDVLYSGRTVRAAMNEIFDFGRPERIILVALVERSGRELPINADIVGRKLDLDRSVNIKLRDDLSLVVEARLT